MIIAITGGAGFIGTALAQRLKDAGHTVRLLDIQKSRVFPDESLIVDVTDRGALTDALAGVDVIYNLAAEHRDDVRPAGKYYDVNVGGAENLIAAAERHGIKTIVFTSSVAVYGLNADPVTGSAETDTPEPFNDYGRSKLEAEKVFERWEAAAPGRTLSTIRLVATFGPGNRGNIHTLMSQIARGKFVMVGKGGNRKSIACVENVAAFLEHALSFGVGQHLYNYADKPDLSTRELVDIIRTALGMPGQGTAIPYTLGLAGGMVFDAAARVTGRNFPISAIRVRKFCADTVVSADKLRETGFAAPLTLAEGLQNMIAHEFAAPGQKAA